MSASLKKIVEDIYKHNLTGSAPKIGDKPYAGAQPHLRSQPEVLPEAECDRRTKIVLKVLIEKIEDATADGGVGVQIMLGNIALNEESKSNWLDLIKTERVSDCEGCDKKMVQICLGENIAHTMPRNSFKWKEQSKSQFQAMNDENKKKLTITMGHPSYYICMATNSKYPEIWQELFEENSLAVIASNNACILPIGNQVELLVGIDSHTVVAGIREFLIASNKTAGWAHGTGTKRNLLQWLFPHSFDGPYGTMNVPLPAPLDAKADFDHKSESHSERSFNHYDTYFAYMNKLQAARSSQSILNFFDIGLIVSLVEAHVAASGNALMVNHENWSTQNEGSVGHTMSKMAQLTKVTYFCKKQAVYNFYIGDGACRLNGGLELIFDRIQNAHEKDDFKPLLNLFVFRNGIWGIEDNLVGYHDSEHVLHNNEYYDCLVAHPQVTLCKTESDLSSKLSDLTQKMDKYTRSIEPSNENEVYDASEWRGKHIEVIVVESFNELPLPPPIYGDTDNIKQSVEMKVFTNVLAHYSQGCKEKIPIYGCSAFEYIQFLNIFLQQNNETSRKFEYCCLKTDIQAAHQIGFDQPEGKAILMINDMFGINSLGESLRSITQSTTNKQILIWIWHPMLLTVMDLFQAHRAPFIWHNPGPQYIKYFFNNDKDLFSWDLKDGDDAAKINKAIDKGTKLLVMNMIPQHERDCIRVQSHLSSV